MAIKVDYETAERLFNTSIEDVYYSARFAGNDRVIIPINRTYMLSMVIDKVIYEFSKMNCKTLREYHSTYGNLDVIIEFIWGGDELYSLTVSFEPAITYDFRNIGFVG